MASTEPMSGRDWQRDEAGRVIFKPGIGTHAVILTEQQFCSLRRARLWAGMTPYALLMVVAFGNGMWWHRGYSIQGGIALIAVFIFFSLLMIGLARRKKLELIAKAERAPFDIELGSMRKVTQLICARFSSQILLVVLLVVAFVDVLLIFDMARLFERGPELAELRHRRVSGPLTGLIVLVPLGYLTYRVAFELWRRLSTRGMQKS